MDLAKEQTFDPDVALIDRVLTGESSAFHDLYTRYYNKVLAIARGILLDQDDAADATQEIFTTAFRNLNRFDRRSKFSTWLFRVAVNRSIQHARSLRHRKKLRPLSEAVDLSDGAGMPAIEDPAIARALANLSPDDRAVLTLYYWEELSLGEIADSLRCNANAAKTRLFRARERFRTHYLEATS